MKDYEDILSKELCKVIKLGYTQSECVAFFECFKLAYDRPKEIIEDLENF